MSPDSNDLPLELRLAAIVTLLSSSALRGATVNKTAALQAHLEAAIRCAGQLNPQLKDALAQSLAGWRKVDCHPASVPVDCCPLTPPGRLYH